MADHDPIEDALNARKRQARLVEAGAAIGTPDRNALDITRKFLGGGQGNQQLPGQASSVAGNRAFGQQGQRKRPGGDIISPLSTGPFVAPTGIAPERTGGSLQDAFFNLPGPVGFASTPQGRAILQRILGSVGRRR
ncbi:hypothetical protein LCGC14_1125500 [marine sediment metagenome]|uniref:Uncharacterized protein n=1 Tax=marine sediment metagenome TaxID=412755 RepID=A0A0F9M7G4_9ZZZZ